jgi:NAD(P)-dependent dehydrogenase (short-subunit alcohol dehydrogenase family)
MKNIVITGASTGIGSVIAQQLLQRGFRVFGSVRKAADAERLQQELGANFVPLLFDVTDETAIEQAAAQVAQQIGDQGLYALINNAGIAVGGPILHLPLDEWRRQFEVNVFGLIATTKAFAPLLGTRKDCPHAPGKIFNVGSVAGTIANPFMGPYCASKHALEGISKSMRAEMLLYGIDVVVLAPGVVKTPIWEKAKKEDMHQYDHTDYKGAIKKLAAYIQVHSEDGYEQEEFGKLVVNIITKPKPKFHYVLVKSRLRNWTILRLLPARLFLWLVGKRLGLLA